MDGNKFLELARGLVADYVNVGIEDTGSKISGDDIAVVWAAKVLMNNKAILISPTRGMIYEVTYNGVKDQMYFDSYKKLDNFCIDSISKIAEG